MDNNVYYLHSDSHLYRADGKGVHRIDSVTGEAKLSPLPFFACSIALLVLFGFIGYMIWTWLRAGGMQ